MTGIKERRILKEPEQGTSFMAIRAAKNLISKADINPEEIDMVLVATATPDMPVASTAVKTATEIGAMNAFALIFKLPAPVFYMVCHSDLLYRIRKVQKGIAGRC